MTSMRNDERRQFGRRESRLEAMVAGRGITPMPCVVRNFSSTGALLEFDATAPEADVFHVMIGSKGIDLLCQTRHRSERQVGVSFVGGDVERFIDAFAARPLLPADPAEPRLAEIAQSRQAGSRQLRRTVLGLGSDVRPAAMIKALVDRFDGIPEFAAAGFRAEPGRGPAELAIFHRAARRGFWREDDGALHWSPTGLGGEVCEAASVDSAVYHTMSFVLAILARQRRSFTSPTAIAEPSASSA
jgi:hypothetical protein